LSCFDFIDLTNTQLSYTRGSVIPCWIVLESGDLQALDIFAEPSSLAVRLQRCVRYQGTALVTMQNIDSTQSILEVASAVWWPHPNQFTAYTRTLEGEIHIPSDLASSSVMTLAQFSISVRKSFPLLRKTEDPLRTVHRRCIPLYLRCLHACRQHVAAQHAGEYHDNVYFEW
jgi:hypothetical protein